MKAAPRGSVKKMLRERGVHRKRVVQPGLIACDARSWIVAVNTQVVSEANARRMWRATWDHSRKQRAAVAAVLLTTRGIDRSRVKTIVMTSLYAREPHKMDSDNLAAAFKAVRDEIALFLTGIGNGRGDGDDRFRWVYLQRKSQEVGIEVGLIYGEVGDGFVR